MIPLEFDLLSKPLDRVSRIKAIYSDSFIPCWICMTCWFRSRWIIHANHIIFYQDFQSSPYIVIQTLQHQLFVLLSAAYKCWVWFTWYAALSDTLLTERNAAFTYCVLCANFWVWLEQGGFTFRPWLKSWLCEYLFCPSGCPSEFSSCSVNALWCAFGCDLPF